MIKYFIPLSLCSLLVSCGQNDTERLSHKWVVSSSAYRTNLPLTIEERNVAWTLTDSIYSQREYDIHEDGTFDMVNKDRKVSGTWNNEDGIVTFNMKGQKQEIWNFSDGIEIYHDSSMLTIVDRSDDKNYTRLVLRPAPGQKVTTDY